MDPLAAQTSATGLAGRARELRAVGNIIDGAAPGAVLVSGEPGIGKSRLVQAALEDRLQVTAVVAACLPMNQNPPLLALRVILRQLLGDVGQEPPQVRGLPTWVGAELASLVPLAGIPVATVGDRATPQPFRMLEAIHAVLRSTPAHHVVVIEDLHWADEGTLDALLFLLASGARCPVPMVLTVRDDPPPAVETVLRRLELSGAVRRVDLRELTASETAEQVRAVMGADVDDRTLADIHRRSGGNPLFVDQLVAHTSSTGAPASTSLPPGLVSLLRARLNSIASPAREVMLALAVAERPLDARSLVEVTGQDPDEVEDQLDLLHHLHLLRSGPREGLVQVRHELIADVARSEGMPSSRRRALHIALAKVLIGREPGAAVEIAEHLAAAGQLGEQVQWRVAAADQAYAVHAPLAAATQLCRAIDVWGESGWTPRPDVTIDPPELYRRAWTAAEQGGDLPRALALAAEASWRLSVEAGPELRVWLAINLAHFQRLESDGRACELLTSALELAGENGLEALAARAHRELATLHLAYGRFESARTHSDASMRLPPGVEGSEGRYLTQRMRVLDLWLSTALGQRSADEAAEGALTLATGGKVSAATRVELSGRVCDLLLDLGRLRAACSLGRSALGVAADNGLAFSYWADVVRYDVVEALLELGDTAGGEDVLGQRRPARGGEGVEDTAAAPQSMPWAAGGPRLAPAAVLSAHMLACAALDLRAGRLDRATQFWSHVVLPPATMVVRREFCLHHLEFAVWVGDPESALGESVEAVESTCRTDQAQFVGPLLALTMRAAVDLVLSSSGSERAARAEGYRGRLVAAAASAPRDPFGDHVSPVAASGHGVTWTAELSRLTSAAAAATAWGEAAQVWRRLERPHRVAYALLRQAEAFVADGANRKLTTQALSAAAEAAVGHAPLLEAVRALARMARVQLVGSPSRGLTPHGDDPRGLDALLSPRESAVLALVIEGRTNPQIGAALHISPKTAGVHVSNLMRKLGARSRVQAAAMGVQLRGRG